MWLADTIPTILDSVPLQIGMNIFKVTSKIQLQISCMHFYFPSKYKNLKKEWFFS